MTHGTHSVRLNSTPQGEKFLKFSVPQFKHLLCKDVVGSGVNPRIPNLEIGGRRPDSPHGHLTPIEGASVTH